MPHWLPRGVVRILSMSTKTTVERAGLEKRIAELEEELDRLRAIHQEEGKSEFKYRRLVEASPYCIKHVGTDGRLLSMNIAGLRMINEEREEDIIGRYYLKVVAPEDLPRVREQLERALAGESPEFEFQTSFGSIFRSNFAPIFGRQDEVIGLLSITQDVTERHAAEAALRVGEERFQLVSRATRDAIFDWDIEAGMVWRNGVYQEVFGAPEWCADSEDWWESRLHPDDRERVKSDQKRAIDECGRWIGEYRFRALNGEYRIMLDRVLVMRDHAGRAIRVVGSLADLTDQRRAETRQQMMVNELDHRVKNNLTVVLALAEQTRLRAASLDDFMDTFGGRLRVLAGSHDALASAHWQGVATSTLLRAALAPHADDDNDRILIRGDSPVVPARASGPLALALHELATNALKYGALSVPSGRLEIRISEKAGAIRIEWKESGVEIAMPQGPGTGLQLVRGFLEHELCGQVEIDMAPSGVRCQMEFPLQSMSPDRDEEPRP